MYVASRFEANASFSLNIPSSAKGSGSKDSIERVLQCNKVNFFE
jgi:hypothetical protein